MLNPILNRDRHRLIAECGASEHVLKILRGDVGKDDETRQRIFVLYGEPHAPQGAAWANKSIEKVVWVHCLGCPWAGYLPQILADDFDQNYCLGRKEMSICKAVTDGDIYRYSDDNWRQEELNGNPAAGLPIICGDVASFDPQADTAVELQAACEKARQGLETAAAHVRNHGNADTLYRFTVSWRRGFRHVNSSDAPGSITLEGAKRQQDRCYECTSCGNVQGEYLRLQHVFGDARSNQPEARPQHETALQPEWLANLSCEEAH